jgi:hypothetical protein
MSRALISPARKNVLGEARQPGGKVVHIWAIESDWDTPRGRARETVAAVLILAASPSRSCCCAASPFIRSGAKPEPPDARKPRAEHRMRIRTNAGNDHGCASASRRSASLPSFQLRASSAALDHVGFWLPSGGSGADLSIVAMHL